MNRKKERRRRREIVILDDDDENEIARKRDNNEESSAIEYINKTYLSEHARDESRFAFTLHGFLNQRDVADERFRWFDFSFLFSFFTFLFAPGVHLGVHLVRNLDRKKSEDEFFRKKALREKMLRVPHWRTILNTYSKIYHQCYKLRS